jgi:hypothetical protein
MFIMKRLRRSLLSIAAKKRLTFWLRRSLPDI